MDHEWREAVLYAGTSGGRACSLLESLALPVCYDIIPYKGRDRLLCTYNIMNLYEI